MAPQNLEQIQSDKIIEKERARLRQGQKATKLSKINEIRSRQLQEVLFGQIC